MRAPLKNVCVFLKISFFIYKYIFISTRNYVVTPYPDRARFLLSEWLCKYPGKKSHSLSEIFIHTDKYPEEETGI